MAVFVLQTCELSILHRGPYSGCVTQVGIDTKGSVTFESKPQGHRSNVLGPRIRLFDFPGREGMNERARRDAMPVLPQSIDNEQLNKTPFSLYLI